MDDYRGFSFDCFQGMRDGVAVEVVRATRGCITIWTHGGDELPEGWTHHAILRRQIDQLVDPAALRHVDALN